MIKSSTFYVCNRKDCDGAVKQTQGYVLTIQKEEYIYCGDWCLRRAMIALGFVQSTESWLEKQKNKAIEA